jgi:hypothetical protein
VLPGIYERWFQELAGRPSPVEGRTHCDDCNMLKDEPRFHPDTRCCTYHPQLPAHLVGALLLQREKLVEERVAERRGVTPHGLGPTPEYAAVWNRLGPRPESFGREPAIVCPFLDGGRCRIWSQRGVGCAAFHCKYDRGPFGQHRWSLITVAFHAVDHALLKRLIAHTGLDAKACDALLRAPGDRELEARAWGSWLSRERDYFLVAAQLAGEARVGEFPELSRLGESLRAALDRLDARPETVRGNREVLYQLGRVRHPSVPFDGLAVPQQLLEKMSALDGARLDSLGLDEEWVRKLLDWQVILPA